MMKNIKCLDENFLKISNTSIYMYVFSFKWYFARMLEFSLQTNQNFYLQIRISDDVYDQDLNGLISQNKDDKLSLAVVLKPLKLFYIRKKSPSAKVN